MDIWTDLMSIQVPAADKVIRTVVVYVALVFMIRFLGQRIIAQMTNLDLVVVLLVSNVVQNAIIGPDNSLLGGLLGAAVLILVNQILDRLQERFSWLRRLLEGTPTTLISDGRIDEPAVRRMGLSVADIAPALRTQGADDIAEVEQATLAPGGALVIDLKEREQAVSRAYLDQALQAALAQLRIQLRDDMGGGR